MVAVNALDPRQEQRLDELLSDAACGPLEPAQQAELDGLLEALGDHTPGAYGGPGGPERAAAALTLALLPARAEPLPAHLAAKISRAGLAAIGPKAAGNGSALRPVRGPRPATWIAVVGWAAAAGLAFVLWTQREELSDLRLERDGRVAAEVGRDEAVRRSEALAADLTLLRDQAREAEGLLRGELARLEAARLADLDQAAQDAAERLAARESELAAAFDVQLAELRSAFAAREDELLIEIEALNGLLGDVDPAALRERLLGEAPDLVRVDWSTTEDPLVAAAVVRGDVIWSPSRQEGYMTFQGLPANRSGEQQYQLWIFDGTRDAARPVDGGVFDVADPSRPVVVPIDAKLDVRDATAFAVTLERAGGVVVSDREHLLLLAAR